MSGERFALVIREFLSTPWAILPEKYRAMCECLAAHRAGQVFTEEEIRARIGAGPATKPAKRAGAVAILPVYGVLSNRISAMEEMSGATSMQKLSAQFKAFVENPEVRAIVLDIDSPGGSVFGCPEFADEIFAAREQKKIIAQVDPVAASAAYWLASQAHEIVVVPSGMAGSIGAFMTHEDVSKAAEMMGVKTTLVSAGKYKVEGNPFEPLSEAGLEHMQELVRSYYDKFVNAVARGRGVKAADVRNGYGEGRMLTADLAKKAGLVDRIATLDDTLQRLGVSAEGRTIVAAGSSSSEAGAENSTEVNAGAVSAGAEFRSTATAESNTEGNSMIPETNPAAAAVVDHSATRTAAIATEETRVATIQQLARLHNVPAATSAAWIREGASADAVVKAITASIATPAAVVTPAAETRPAVQVTTDEADKIRPSIRAARMVRAIGAARGDVRNAAQIARTTFLDPVAAAALDASSLSGGGVMIPEAMSSDLIEYLRPQTVVRSSNPMLAPMVNGQLSLPKITGGSTATYIGENQDIPATKPSFGGVKASAKKLAAIVPISNDLIRYASFAADSIVRDDLASALAQAEDGAFLRNAGTQFSPKGLLFWAPAASKIAAQANPDPAKVTVDLGKIFLALAKGNTRFLRPGYIFSARTFNYLFNLRDANSNFVYRDEMKGGTLNGYPFKWTTLVPDNLGVGTDESEVYLADFADVVICDVPVMVVETSSEATYWDGTKLVSAFSQDQTVIKVIEEHDLVVRHAESIAILTTVKWI